MGSSVYFRPGRKFSHGVENVTEKRTGTERNILSLASLKPWHKSMKQTLTLHAWADEQLKIRV